MGAVGRGLWTARGARRGRRLAAGVQRRSGGACYALRCCVARCARAALWQWQAHVAVQRRRRGCLRRVSRRECSWAAAGPAGPARRRAATPPRRHAATARCRHGAAALTLLRRTVRPQNPKTPRPARRGRQLTESLGLGGRLGGRLAAAAATATAACERTAGEHEQVVSERAPGRVPMPQCSAAVPPNASAQCRAVPGLGG